MKRTTRFFAAILAVVVASTALFTIACVPDGMVAVVSTPEPTPTLVPTAAPTATSTTSPIPTPTPEPYFDLENMTDEDLLFTYGMSIEDVNKTIGYAFGNSGVDIIEYVANNIVCTTAVTRSSRGGKQILYDFPASLYSGKPLMTTDDNTFDDASIGSIEEILNNDKIYNNEPFPGELIIGKDEVVNVMITRAIPIAVYRRYLELQGLSVPETKWSQDMEGLEMLGNVVSIVGMLRYFLTIAPHEEVMNHFKLNYPLNDWTAAGISSD